MERALISTAAALCVLATVAGPAAEAKNDKDNKDKNDAGLAPLAVYDATGAYVGRHDTGNALFVAGNDGVLRKVTVVKLANGDFVLNAYERFFSGPNCSGAEFVYITPSRFFTNVMTHGIYWRGDGSYPLLNWLGPTMQTYTSYVSQEGACTPASGLRELAVPTWGEKLPFIGPFTIR